ncbi:AraC family transcriptional regulator [Cohnella sp. 56]|uniref:AraC family transcriptional regulator n=1 Tax=Cohnella sp. 56 TaxID=3113722 RepID=UPI0030EA715C
MNKSFDHIRFGGEPFDLAYRKKSEDSFKGYYHWHQCCELLYVHGGQGTVIVNGQSYELTGGMLFFFQPFELHYIHASVGPGHPYERTIVHGDPHYMERLLAAFPRRRQQFARLCTSSRKQRAYRADLQQGGLEWAYGAYAQAALRGREETEEEASLLLAQLMTFIESAGQEDEENEAPLSRRPWSYSETIMQWIEAHYQEEFDLERLADELHLSKFYVSRLFRRETGSSISDYLSVRRIKRACRLLQTTTLPVERIGAQVGLPNAPYFIQLFKRIVGITPLKYRNHT